MAQVNQFQIVYLKEAMEFIRTLPLSAQKKIFYNADKVSRGFVSSELFKNLEGNSDLWEFRTLYDGMQYRLLAFWDEQEQRMVVATHGFVKKTWKVPAKEIQKAEQLRKKYFNSK